MKIIHTSDLHLGSPMAFLGDKKKSRRVELFNAFKRLINFAKENGVKIILLSGDVFDSDSVSKDTKSHFYSIIRNNPNIDFLYLKGNHDKQNFFDEEIPNLKIFGQSWISYSYDDVTISGIELTNVNRETLYDALKLNTNSFNIVMLHGQVATSLEKENDLLIKKLQNKSIDYLALGHIHSYELNKLDERGYYCYSGCLEGRDFGETGKKGFVLIDTSLKEYKFIPNSERIVEIKDIDISKAQSVYDAIDVIGEAIKNIDLKNIIRLNLVGRVSFLCLEESFEQFVKDNLDFDFYYLEIVNKTTRKVDYKKFLNEESLRGEFLRSVESDTEHNEEDKLKIIDLGLSLLNGDKIEI